MKVRERRRPRAAERGFTLIELMVALVVSSLLVGMILAIFMRISIAYRGQQQVAEVQSKLAAARAKLELDAKHAGLALPNGFYAPGGLRSPLRVINHPNAPDEIAFYYADTSVQAVTSSIGTVCDDTQCDRIDSTEGFAVGDVVVRSTALPYEDNLLYNPNAPIARFEACIFRLASVGPTSFRFDTALPWGDGGSNLYCEDTPNIGKTMFYKMVGRHWRIDPTRPAEGVLQLSQLGSLVGVDDWQDQGYGFTDLQIATRFHDRQGTLDTADPDDDPKRHWYSGENQEVFTDASMLAQFRPIQVSISLVARTERDVDGIASSSTPNLTVVGNADDNTIGDRPAIALPSGLAELSGNRIFRYTTFMVDLRNLGVGL